MKVQKYHTNDFVRTVYIFMGKQKAATARDALLTITSSSNLEVCLLGSASGLFLTSWMTRSLCRKKLEIWSFLHGQNKRDVVDFLISKMALLKFGIHSCTLYFYMRPNLMKKLQQRPKIFIIQVVENTRCFR